MAQFKCVQVARGDIIPSADGARDVVPLVADFTIPAGFAAGDTVLCGQVLGGYVPVDLVVDHDGLGGTATADVGLFSGALVGSEFISGADLSSAGIKRLSAAGGARVLPSTGDRNWGVGFSAVVAPAAGAKFRATLFVRAQSEGV